MCFKFMSGFLVVDRVVVLVVVGWLAEWVGSLFGCGYFVVWLSFWFVLLLFVFGSFVLFCFMVDWFGFASFPTPTPPPNNGISKDHHVCENKTFISLFGIRSFHAIN